jgi:hypothetical protein
MTDRYAYLQVRENSTDYRSKSLWPELSKAVSPLHRGKTVARTCKSQRGLARLIKEKDPQNSYTISRWARLSYETRCRSNKE